MTSRAELLISLKDGTRTGAASVKRGLVDLGTTAQRTHKSLATAFASDSARRMATNVGHLRNQMSGLVSLGMRLSQMAIFGGGAFGVGILAGGAAIAKSVAETGMEFETFATRLDTLTGSAEKGREALAWVEDFATRTPYDLAQVTDAFVRATAAGMDPMTGSLKIMGDTAAATGKSLEQVVEAVADAQRGDQERLKELGTGVRIKTSGNQATITYKDSTGKDVVKKVKNDEKLVREALLGIFSTKFAGAADALSKKLSGKLSNISDALIRFKKSVFQSGFGDALAEQAQKALDWVDRMTESGDMQRWATMAGEALGSMVRRLSELGQQLATHVREHWPEIKSRMADAWAQAKQFAGTLVDLAVKADGLAKSVGGWGEALKLVAAIKLGGMALTVGKLVVDSGRFLRALTGGGAGGLPGGGPAGALAKDCCCDDGPGIPKIPPVPPVGGVVGALTSPVGVAVGGTALGFAVGGYVGKKYADARNEEIRNLDTGGGLASGLAQDRKEQDRLRLYDEMTGQVPLDPWGFNPITGKPNRELGSAPTHTGGGGGGVMMSPEVIKVEIDVRSPDGAPVRGRVKPTRGGVETRLKLPRQATGAL